MNNQIFITGFILLIVLGSVVGIRLMRRKSIKKEAYQKLRSFYKEKRNYIMYASIKGNERVWRKVDYVEETSFIVDGENVDANLLNSYIVAYQNGEALDAWNLFHPLPKEIHYTMVANQMESIQFKLEDLDQGKNRLEIFHENIRYGRDKHDYSTIVKNVSNKKIKVQGFGGVVEVNGEYVLNNFTNRLFTEEQFMAWYGTDPDGWIKPGQKVFDPRNYGVGCGGYWIYYCMDEDRTSFVAGAPNP